MEQLRLSSPSLVCLLSLSFSPFVSCVLRVYRQSAEAAPKFALTSSSCHPLPLSFPLLLAFLFSFPSLPSSSSSPPPHQIPCASLLYSPSFLLLFSSILLSVCLARRCLTVYKVNVLLWHTRCRQETWEACKHCFFHPTYTRVNETAKSAQSLSFTVLVCFV